MPKNKHTQQPAPEMCPVCGENVPRGALACPECGADHRSGWKEDAGAYDSAGLPDEEFDYDEFVAEEFGTGHKPKGIATTWWIAAIVLICALLVLWLFSGR